jgi:hypothetical protein
VAGERLAELLAGDGREVGQVQVEVDRRSEEPVLAAVVAHDHRRVDVVVGGDGADGRALEALRREAVSGCREDRRPGLV